jgi:hypothetical protein
MVPVCGEVLGGAPVLGVPVVPGAPIEGAPVEGVARLGGAGVAEDCPLAAVPLPPPALIESAIAQVTNHLRTVTLLVEYIMYASGVLGFDELPRKH